MPSPSTSNPLVRGRELSIQTVHESNLRSQHLATFFNSIDEGAIGLAPIYGANVALASLVMVSETSALVVHLKASGPSTKGRRLLQDALLSEDSIVKYAFLMDKLVFSLYHGFKIRVSSAHSLLKPQADDTIHHSAASNALAGIPGKIATEELVQLFKNNEGKGTSVEEAVRQAWLAYFAGSSPSRQSKLTLFESSTQQSSHLQAISQLYCLAIRLRNLKPDVVKNDVESTFKVGKGSVELTSTRFKTRITQASTRQNVEIKIRNHQGQVVDIAANTKKVNGRGVQLSTTKSMATAASIVSVKTYGREPATNIEATRHRLLANILQGTVTILSNPFVQAIFFPQDSRTPWPSYTPPRPHASRSVVLTNRMMLNNSQSKAVEAIISLDDRHRVVLIHGPPGTGKTTVIAASTQSIVASDPHGTIYLVAHSNVAVKNIAEKLLTSDFLDFKIIVSKEFHFDWHEHLYEKVEKNLIRTDSLPDDPLAAQRLLLGSRVILSTLSNMLNFKMGEITRVVPVETLVIDEASQIEVGDYIPVIHRFQRTLQKMVFIGDDKQLAPYGQEQIKELESIFEKRHLRGSAILLDTQYRMPVPIGSFISKHVYGGKLKTQHPLTSPKTCRFIDVRNSQEQKRGHSWVNIREGHAVIAVAKQLNALGLAYRIITPYDPQRSYLESELKNQKLPYEDKCFNVDSFQGNESDYIIVSLVRSANKLGFLGENRRVNVMLTRCKKGMIVCTNRTFVEGVAKKSLVGKLASSLEGDPWVEARRILYAGASLFT